MMRGGVLLFGVLGLAGGGNTTLIIQKHEECCKPRNASSSADRMRPFEPMFGPHSCGEVLSLSVWSHRGIRELNWPPITLTHTHTYTRTYCNFPLKLINEAYSGVRMNQCELSSGQSSPGWLMWSTAGANKKRNVELADALLILSNRTREQTFSFIPHSMPVLDAFSMCDRQELIKK